jgi:hypothetical protein
MNGCTTFPNGAADVPCRGGLPAYLSKKRFNEASTVEDLEVLDPLSNAYIFYGNLELI